MRVCVYAIFRDERHNAHDWANNTADADEVVVLDTGSGDGTVDALIGEGLGIHVHHAAFDPFRFDDARNTALALIDPNVDLCLRLDADERLQPDWRDVIEEHYDPNFARYRYRVYNDHGNWGMHTREDLHARFGQRWKYPTHEILGGPGAVHDLPGLVVLHNSNERRPHHDTNLEVLGAASREDPRDHRMAFYYGRELYYRGTWQVARIQLVNFLALPGGWAAERCEAYRLLADMDDYPERWLWKAVGEAPDRREPWVDLAWLFANRKQWDRAMTMILEAGLRTDDTIYTTTPRAWGQEFEHLRVSIEHEALAI